MENLANRKSLPIAILFLLLHVWAISPVHAQPAHPLLGGSNYASGRVIIKLNPDFSPAGLAPALNSYQATILEDLGQDMFTVAVPAGQENHLIQQLQHEPAVAWATLDTQLTMPPLPANTEPSPPLQAGQPTPPGATGIITETLRMSISPAGPPLPDDTLPTESPLVYVVFDYANVQNETVRVQVYALDIESSPIQIYTRTETFNGTGTATIPIPAYEYFQDDGTFPIGNYLTLLHESIEASWRTVGTVTWHVSTRPNDRWFLANRYQWNLHNTGIWGKRDADIDAPEAWDITTGSDEIIIAIISTGVVLDHPDLKNKIWKNSDEIPNNGLDDDGNGFVDDVNGYEFFAEEDNPDPSDDIGWGTFAAGIAAAETNNQIGMAGVSWGARIMPVKVVRLFITSNAQVPAGYISDLIQGIHYAADNGARVIFVAPILLANDFEKVEALRLATEYAADKGALIIGVAGDQGANLDVYPALYPQVLAVGATDFNDELSSFSNTGLAVREGVVAPGKLILSTCMPYLPACVDEYPLDTHGQTAWAAAQVAGTASLIWSVNPQLSPDEVRLRIRETADDLGPPGADLLFGHGRLNAGRAVRITRHLLNLEIPDLYYLVDDQDETVCRTIRNSTTGPFSWAANENVEWLRVNGPTGNFTPSQMEVCVIREALPDYGTYTANITILSTLDTQTEPVNIPVVVKYIPHKVRVFVPMIGQ